jgi:hypothetical protein
VWLFGGDAHRSKGWVPCEEWEPTGYECCFCERPMELKDGCVCGPCKSRLHRDPEPEKIETFMDTSLRECKALISDDFSLMVVRRKEEVFISVDRGRRWVRI